MVLRTAAISHSAPADLDRRSKPFVSCTRPKTYQDRQVALPTSVRDVLAQHLADYVGPDKDALVFTTDEGAPLRLSNFRSRVWWPALEAARLPKTVRIHDLRHAAASFAIATGANVKQVQAMLGHSSAMVTLDVYADLLPDDADDLAAKMDETFKRAQTASRST